MGCSPGNDLFRYDCLCQQRRSDGAAVLIQCGGGRRRQDCKGYGRQEEVIRDGHGYCDLYSLMGDLDRRALSSVSSNQGGQFSKEEQDMAQSIMSQQQGWAMGLPSGPTRLVEGIPDPFNDDNAARMKAAVKWLDGVSNDEKATVSWASSRASAQISYEWIVDDQNQTPENLDSDSPMVKLIKSAMDTMKDSFERGFTSGFLNSKDELKKQTWFQGFEDQLDDAQRRSEELYQRKG